MITRRPLRARTGSLLFVSLRGGLLVALSGVLLVGCTIFPARESYYYALEYRPPDESLEPLDIGVARVFDAPVAASYNRRQIVIRDGSPRYQYLNDDLWGVELGNALVEFLERRFQDSGTFSRLVDEFSPVEADYEVHSAVRRVEFFCCDTPEARVELVFELRDENSITVFRHVVDTRRPVDGSDLVAFASVVNDVFMSAVVEFDELIREGFDSNAN